MNKKTVVVFSVVSTLALAACSGGEDSGDESRTLQLGHTGAPDHHYQEISEQFAELVAKRTNDELEIDIYPSDQLGSQLDSVEGVMLGTQDMVLTSDTVLSNWEEDVGLLNLPYLFSGPEHLREVLDGEIGEELSSRVSSHGAEVLAWWDGGFRHMTSSVAPIETPEDLQGLSIRVPEGDLFSDAFEAFGASPTIVPFGELYSALQLGTVDAQENPPAHIYTQNFYEVQDYVSRTGHNVLNSPLLINGDLLESLSEEHQEVLTTTAHELGAVHTEMILEEEDELWGLLEDEMEINDPDTQPFQEIAEPVIDEYRDILDGEIIDQIIELR